MAEESKPSFFRSTLSGIAGTFKGALAGAGVGAVMGAVLGAGFAVATGGFGLAAIAFGAIVGAELLAIPMSIVGALSGTVTGVVTSRETAQPSAGDMMNVAKIAYAQGVSVGRQLEQEQGQGTETTKWRDRHAQEQAAKAVAPQGQTIH
jgi:hypothetical protein